MSAGYEFPSRTTRTGRKFSSLYEILPAVHFSATEALEQTRRVVVDDEYSTDVEGEEIRGGIQETDNPDKGLYDPNTNPSMSTHPLSRQQKQNLRSKRKRNDDRLEEMASNDGLKRHVRKRRDNTLKKPQIVEMNMEQDLEPTKPGWVGKKDSEKSTQEFSLEELEKRGHKYVDFRGDQAEMFVDSYGYGWGIICPPPSDNNYEAVHQRVAYLLETYRGRFKFSPNASRSRRGNFAAINVGISHGGGQTAPVNLQLYDNAPIAEAVMKNPDVHRIAMHANSCFRTYAPDLYKDYDDLLNKLCRWSPNVRRNYTGNVFACAALNLGPRTVSFPHHDFANLSWGLCAITAFGDYNPDTGGHFVMREPKLVVRFPPGSVILLPSAMVEHSNTPIGPNEHRYSFAQFSAGGLFHFVDNGFQTDEHWNKKASCQQILDRKDAQKTRYLMGLSKLHKIQLH